jgi:hypothetical protein
MSEQQKDPGQPLFARIEKLINQIFFVTDVARQQIGHEHVGKFVFPMKRFHHGFLVDSQNSTIRHCGCRTHADGWARKRTFAEKVSLTYYADRCFLASLGYDSESNLALLDVEESVSRIPVSEDYLFLGNHEFPNDSADRGPESPAFDGANMLERIVQQSLDAMVGHEWQSRLVR